MTRFSGLFAIAALAVSGASGLIVDKRGKIAKRVTILPSSSGSDEAVHKLQGEAQGREGAIANDLSDTVNRLAADGQKRAEAAAKQAQQQATAAPAVIKAAEVTDAKPPTGVPNPQRQKKQVEKAGSAATTTPAAVKGAVSSVTAESADSLKAAFGSGAKDAAKAKKEVPEEQKWDMIKEYRAEKCTEREDPLNHADCMTFMEEICNPGGNDGPEGEAVQMNGEEGENGSGKGFCSAFYTNVEKQKEREANGGEEKKEEEKKEETGSGEAEPEAEPAPAASTEEEKEEPKPLSDAVADSDSSGSGPTGMDRRVLGDGRVHVDGKTQVGGWRNEYGPGVADTYSTACADHPYNHWCLEHGYSFSIFYSPIWYLIMGIIIGVSGFTLFTVYKQGQAA